MLTSSAPVAVSQKPTEFSVGNATSRVAELQRHDEVHQPDDERHGDEEDHDRAVRREDLVVVLGRQDSPAPGRRALLRAHQQRVDEAAQQHHHREHHVHHADALVVDARQPLAPDIRQVSLRA